MACPGSVALEAQCPTDTAGAHAAEGTLAHTLASDFLGSPAGKHPSQRIGQVHDVDGFSFTVDEIMADYVDDYIRLVRDYAKRGMLLVEQRVPIGHITGEEGATGKVAGLVREARHLETLDPASKALADRLAEALAVAIGGALAGALAWYAVKLVRVSREFNDVSTGADATPLWLPQTAMALGCVGLFVALADAALARATGRVFEHAGSGEAARVE
jgi:hypothetical protein